MATKQVKNALISHQGYANQKQNELPLHTHQDGYTQKKAYNNKYWQWYGETRTLVRDGDQCEVVQPPCKTVCSLLKGLATELQYHSAIPIWENIYSRKMKREMKTYIHVIICTWMFRETLFIITKK